MLVHPEKQPPSIQLCPECCIPLHASQGQKQCIQCEYTEIERSTELCCALGQALTLYALDQGIEGVNVFDTVIPIEIALNPVGILPLLALQSHKRQDDLSFSQHVPHWTEHRWAVVRDLKGLFKLRLVVQDESTHQMESLLLFDLFKDLIHTSRLQSDQRHVLNIESLSEAANAFMATL